jgi:hypothetical protein
VLQHCNRSKAEAEEGEEEDASVGSLFKYSPPASRQLPIKKAETDASKANPEAAEKPHVLFVRAFCWCCTIMFL